MGDEEAILPSQILENDTWRRNVLELIYHGDRIDFNDTPTEDAKKRANLLLCHLRHRFEQFKRNKIKVQSKRMDWPMQFHGMNLPMCSALAVLLQIVKLDLTCMNERDCLLTIDRSVFPPIENHLNLAGVYIFEDKLRGIFNRAGKATGHENTARGSFGTRKDEHLKASKADSPKSEINRLFPSQDSKRASLKGNKGLFETHLEMRMAIGFDRKSEAAQMLDKDYREGGIMILNEAMKEQIKNSMKHLKSDLLKFQDMFAYLMEDVFVQLLSPDHCLDTNPGY